METRLTIRLPAKQRETLKRRVAVEKLSESALVRDLIDRDLQWGFDFGRVRHSAGKHRQFAEALGEGSVAETYPPAQLATEPQELTKKTKMCVPGDVDQTRTWNLMLDPVAQSGRYRRNATSLQNGFVVKGEQRYWYTSRSIASPG